MLYAFKLGRKLRGEEPYCPEKGGKGGSSDKSAKYAAEAQKYAADLQNKQFNTIMNNLKPFTPLADKYLGSLENLSSLEGQGQALNQYSRRFPPHVPFRSFCGGNRSVLPYGSRLPF